MMLPVFRAAVARGLRSSGGKYSSALGAVGYPRHAPNLTFGGMFLRFLLHFVCFFPYLHSLDWTQIQISIRSLPHKT